ncbi:MAG: pseudouridine synthase, partial [Burkholderiales bacterium]
PSVFDNLPPPGKGQWVAVGRLDFNTGGLLILTTSGDLANRLMHPRFEVEREYAVRLKGELSGEQLRQLHKGIALSDGLAHFEDTQLRGGEGVNRWYHVVLKEGRNREVRRMFAALGLTVSRLMRVRFGPVELPSWLKRGCWSELDSGETENILRWAGNEETPPAPVR